jgi:orotate phosphoribosyltransferase
MNKKTSPMEVALKQEIALQLTRAATQGKIANQNFYVLSLAELKQLQQIFLNNKDIKEAEYSDTEVQYHPNGKPRIKKVRAFTVRR